MVDAKIRLTFLNETDLKIKPQTCLDTLVSLSTFYVCFWRIFSLHAVLDGGFWRINLELKKKAFEEKEGSSYSIYSSSYTMQTNDFKPTFIPIVTIQSVTRETDSHLKKKRIPILPILARKLRIQYQVLFPLKVDECDFFVGFYGPV